MTTMLPQDQIKFVRSLLGTPYKLNSYDPLTGFDCWSCVNYIELHAFGRELPEYYIREESAAGYVQAMIEGKQLVNWVSIPEPEHGCIVELCQNKIPTHVGVYLDLPQYKVKGLMHCLQGAGVIFDPWITLKAAGWRRFVYNVPRSS